MRIIVTLTWVFDESEHSFLCVGSVSFLCETGILLISQEQDSCVQGKESFIKTGSAVFVSRFMIKISVVRLVRLVLSQSFRADEGLFLLGPGILLISQEHDSWFQGEQSHK